MKKTSLFPLLLFSMLLSYAYSQTVYVTPSGKKYHTENCRYSKTATAINLSDAIAKGKTACSVCNPSSSESNKNESQQQVTETTDKTVYITKSGTKYHRSSCRYVSQSSIAIILYDAELKGYSACSVCNPSSANRAIETEDKNYTAPVKKTTQTVQCSATTKAGTQCKRMTSFSNGKCWQHGGN